MRHPAFTLLCLFVLSTCRGPVTRNVNDPPPDPPAACGDGILQTGEDCDGSDPGSGTCQSLGFDTGRLVCNATTCKYDTTLCVKRCGNGVLDLGESCDRMLGVDACATWGANVCTSSCTLDTSHCVGQAFEPGPTTDMTKGGPAVVGDLSPKGPGDLVVAVPAFTRVEIVPWSMTQGFDATASRKLSFLRYPERAELIDANDDGNTDIAQINSDGTVDLLVFNGATYSLNTLDAGCAGGAFLPSNGKAGHSLVVTGCGGYSTVSATGGTFVSTPSSTAIGTGPFGVIWADTTPSIHSTDGGTSTLPSGLTEVAGGDLDGDGDEDLAAISTAGIELFENTGFGFAARATFTATIPNGLRVIDIDGDGRLDLFWASGEDVVIRRNRSQFIFTETRIAAGVGTRKSVSLGDADGDQDLDVVVTVSTGADSTTSRVFLNRVR